MKKLGIKIICLLILFLAVLEVQLAAQETKALEKWLSGEGLHYSKTPLDSSHVDAFTIFIPQFVDHQYPEKGQFLQKVYLTHISDSLPMVMITEGYSANRNYLSEPASILGCNQIIVEHRYFGESLPDSLDWSQLTTANAAADHHHIYQLFSQYYTKKWMSTGISKGGQTSIFYKYYYPDDMAVTMPYVAPLNLEQEDVRINWFLRHVGSKKENAVILNYQRMMLDNFDSIFPYFSRYAQSRKEKYAVNDTLAYEFMVLEFPFSYFQWGSLPFDSIPLQMLSAEKMLNPMMNLNLVSFYFQSSIDRFTPFMVQAYRELGYYNYDVDSLKSHLRKVENTSNIVFLPENLRFEYNQNLMKHIYQFIENKGNQMIYIYGEVDPWFSTSLNPDSRTNAMKLVLAGGNHTTRLMNFSPEIQQKVIYKLKKWLSNE